MPTPITELNFNTNTVDGFFNELEQDVRDSIVVSGVYKLTQNTSGGFTLAEIVSEVEDDAVFDEEAGRAEVRDENELCTSLYVKFEV